MISQQDIMILKCDYIIIIAKIINEKEKWNFEFFFPSTTHQSGFTLIGKMMSLKRNKKKLFNSYLLCPFFVRNVIRFPCLLKCGFYKKLLLCECNSDQLPTFFISSSLLGGCNSKSIANPPKSDD